MRMTIDEINQEIKELEKEILNCDDEERKYNLQCEINELKNAINYYSDC